MEGRSHTVYQIMEALTNISNYGNAHKYAKLRKCSQIPKDERAHKCVKLRKRSQIFQITGAITNMPNSGSTHKYAKLRKRSQICQMKRSQICQTPEALTNMPNYRSAHKCAKLRKLTNHGIQYLPILSARLPSRMAPTRKPNIRADMVALAIQFL
jgi:hypothetical protein